MIRLYKDDPTAGGVDGTEVSSGTNADPVESGDIIIPSSGFADGSWVKLALRCEDGHETREYESRHARVTIVDSDHLNKWQLAPDDSDSPDDGNATDWDDTPPEVELDFNSQIDDTNTIFWARARVEDGESVANDSSVQFRIEAVIGAA